MKVLIPSDKEFDYEKCKKMYEDFSSRVKDDSSFDEVLEYTFFYSFYDDDLLTLCVYFYHKEGKLWVNGYGIRNKHLYNRECFKTALSWFNCDVWARTPYRDVAWAILRCGFEKVKNNIYVFRQNNNRKR